jgi:hypothetical protein
LGLYGVANVLAGAYDLITEARLAPHVAVALVGTGALLMVATIAVAVGSQQARAIAIVALVLASALAVYNERALDLGHPTHHMVRGLYTLLLLWVVVRATRTPTKSESTA